MFSNEPIVLMAGVPSLWTNLTLAEDTSCSLFPSKSTLIAGQTQSLLVLGKVVRGIQTIKSHKTDHKVDYAGDLDRIVVYIVA
jgi:hypothetical protein